MTDIRSDVTGKTRNQPEKSTCIQETTVIDDNISILEHWNDDFNIAFKSAVIEK